MDKNILRKINKGANYDFLTIGFEYNRTILIAPKDYYPPSLIFLQHPRSGKMEHVALPEAGHGVLRVDRVDQGDGAGGLAGVVGDLDYLG